MAARLRTSLALLALRELGIKQTGLYAWYRFLLGSGYLRRKTPAGGNATARIQETLLPRTDLIPLPDPNLLKDLLAGQVDKAFAQAEEVISGTTRLFGAEPVPLQLSPPGPLQHWTRYGQEDGRIGEVDVKMIWEPARFGWVFPLARAYYLSGDERYVTAFWQHTETFLIANPANLGPNWVSGQEVALRLIALAFAWQVFHPSSQSTPNRVKNLVRAIIEHAMRIPPGLAYARAQNNNHLLTEAAGLLTAGLILPGHPSARRWHELGWKWFNRGLQDQIAEDGAYVQHSTNYHRLMLQVALWVNLLGRSFPEVTRQRLAGAAHWLQALLDPQSGRAPNLGHNDGSYLFPLTILPYEDYRPVVQAAARAFQGRPALPPGLWDEMSAWFGTGCAEYSGEVKRTVRDAQLERPTVLQNPTGERWAYLRAARFTSRPAHADQLHLDVWWRGLNLAMDPGTYRYNAPPPWENALRATQVHNTIMVDGQDQMVPAGRFLWLDWAQAELDESRLVQEDGAASLSARHTGYRRLGIIHSRTIAFENESRLVVEDRLLPVKAAGAVNQHTFTLHWLLPDWPWEGLAEGSGIRHSMRLKSPLGWIELQVNLPSLSGEQQLEPMLAVTLVRAGERLAGSGLVQPFAGWYSPTYAHKIPALSLSAQWSATPPSTVLSIWSFPE